MNHGHRLKARRGRGQCWPFTSWWPARRYRATIYSASFLQLDNQIAEGASTPIPQPESHVRQPPEPTPPRVHLLIAAVGAALGPAFVISHSGATSPLRAAGISWTFSGHCSDRNNPDLHLIRGCPAGDHQRDHHLQAPAAAPPPSPPAPRPATPEAPTATKTATSSTSR